MEYECDICNYKTKKRLFMKKHKLRHESNNYVFICNVCCYKIQEKSDIYRHFKSIIHKKIC